MQDLIKKARELLNNGPGEYLYAPLLDKVVDALEKTLKTNKRLKKKLKTK